MLLEAALLAVINASAGFGHDGTGGRGLPWSVLLGGGGDASVNESLRQDSEGVSGGGVDG